MTEFKVEGKQVVTIWICAFVAAIVIAFISADCIKTTEHIDWSHPPAERCCP